MSNDITITLPDVLGRRSPVEVEGFIPDVFSRVGSSRFPVIFDLRHVQWVCPYGALLLLDCCTLLAQSTGHAVRITGLQPKIHAYLRRIDFFLAAGSHAFTDDAFEGEDLSRRPDSSNVLELTRIVDLADMRRAMAAAQRILAYWLTDPDSDIGRVGTLISESCTNIVLHSGTSGWIVVQKYERLDHGVVDVELAIGDLGMGIRASLREVHGEVAADNSGYILKALQGMSARGIDETGQGLGAIRNTTVTSGGHLLIRSSGGRLWVNGAGVKASDDSIALPGTHLALRFRSQA